MLSILGSFFISIPVINESVTGKIKDVAIKVMCVCGLEARRVKDVEF